MSTAALGSAVVLLACLTLVAGHGMLQDPPARNTMWRYGFDNPPNHDDNALNCGGRSNQWERNAGKCGVCGDPYQGPLKHEAEYSGEGFANGIIVKSYKKGDIISTETRITANHKGHLKFKICSANNNAKISQDCLDEYPLTDDRGRTEIPIEEQIGQSAGLVRARLQLPAGLTCSQCVLQWTYTAGNNPGTIQQETFVNCADVQITESGGPVSATTTTTRQPVTTRTRSNSKWTCEAVAPYNYPSTEAWCMDNCANALSSQRNCPETHCHCYNKNNRNQVLVSAERR